jgi:hypothetical protein
MAKKNSKKETPPDKGKANGKEAPAAVGGPGIVARAAPLTLPAIAILKIEQNSGTAMAPNWQLVAGGLQPTSFRAPLPLRLTCTVKDTNVPPTSVALHVDGPATDDMIQIYDPPSSAPPRTYIFLYPIAGKHFVVNGNYVFQCQLVPAAGVQLTAFSQILNCTP